MSLKLIDGLSQLAPDYDALICDVWGVVHDGHHAHEAACDALRRFRADFGPVILLTNAPRVPAAVKEQFVGIGVPEDCYDAIVSSGGAARAEIAARAAAWGATAQRSEATALGGATRNKPLSLYYIGSSRDLSIFEGLDVVLSPLETADVVLCAGLRDDDTESPALYAEEMAAIRKRGLIMLCANPDLVVHRGPRLYWCAGALARDYALLGGEVIYYGKPHKPVYDMARAAAMALGRGAAQRPLAIGDGMPTDIKGANAQGLDVLFIADGIHGEEIEPYNAAHLTQLLSANGVHAAASLRTLIW